ncbi:ankyrin repeat domain containing protein [Pandoravirus japonicus]|uniref:Ankyrin repeat domain containing protein n=1 Tax=Pandoravirus japonicus TaxID=2823154 RepID=A0A811BNM9_9VIRU|nr:ankyrin repeat domain containing protein [Pandoravirus japonicus]
MHGASTDCLPDEVLAEIFGWLPCLVADAYVARVCTHWRRIAKCAAALGRPSCIDRALATARTKATADITSPPTAETQTAIEAHVAPSYKHCMRAAADLGHAKCMDRIYDPERPWPLALAADAAARGRLDVLVWLWRRGFVFTNGALYAAARCANIACMAYLADHGCTIEDDGWATVCAAESGSVGAIDWLRDRGCPWHPHLVVAAIGSTDHGAEHVYAATHAVLGGCPWRGDAQVAVVYAGHADLLHAMLVRGLAIDSDLCKRAVDAGHAACVALLCQHRAPWSAEHCSMAAGRGRLDIVQMLRAAGCPWDAAVFSAAVFGGHAHMVMWLHSRGCLRDANATALAAFAGHLDLLRWLLADGCPRTQSATHMAAMSGHLNALALLHEAGCPWTKDTCRSAACEGHLDCLVYAHERGCPIPRHTASLAHTNGHAACAAYAAIHETEAPA